MNINNPLPNAAWPRTDNDLARGPAPANHDAKPWTIKYVSPEDRNAALAAAARASMTMGEWLSRAIRSQIQADHNQDRAPAVVPKANTTVALVSETALVLPAPPVDLDALERLVGVAIKVGTAGNFMSRGARGTVNAIVRKGLRDLRGRSKPVSSPPGS